MSEERSIREIRLEKLARLREIGLNPYAVEEWETTSAASLLAGFEEGKSVSFAGRLVSYRLMGKAGFAHLSDGDSKVQGYFKKDDLGDTQWEAYNLLDIGDHVGVEGELFVTKTGEKSIHVRRLQPLSKSLQNLPIGKVREVKDDAGNVVGHEQWYELEDVELRYRHRHLDLIANANARKMLVDRSKIVSAVRRYFDSQGYLEVETPLLQVVAGGAAARPFTTMYNAYDMEVKLRISLELYLKRLICGDLPRVYEIGRVFRNEGVSNRHNPEFSLLEFYEAYTNLEGMMRRVEEMFRFVALDVYGSALVANPGQNIPIVASRVTTDGVVEQVDVDLKQVEVVSSEPIVEIAAICGGKARANVVSGTVNWVSTVHEEVARDFLSVDGSAVLKVGRFEIDLATGVYQLVDRQRLDFSKPWRRVDLISEICRLSGLAPADLDDLAAAKAAIQAKGVLDKAHEAGGHISLEKEDTLGGLIEKLLEVFVEPTLQEPTFVVGYPIETSPLAKKDPKNPRMTRRFEGYILGREICNAFSEINDPIDQLERFENQVHQLAGGNEEAHPMDHEFVYALEGGMPPTGGCGIGMERLAMVLTGAEHIREVMLFPMMKPL